jgi:hypothetical protein
VKVIDVTSDDKQVLSIKVRRIFIRPGWGMELLTRPYDQVELFGDIPSKLFSVQFGFFDEMPIRAMHLIRKKLSSLFFEYASSAG